VKTLVDEQEVQSSPEIKRDERVRQETPVVMVSQKKVVPATPADTQQDCYESCLDLAALFLGRG
jgi:hypothetical protein